MEFKRGDRVVYKGTQMSELIGRKGTITKLLPEFQAVYVIFDGETRPRDVYSSSLSPCTKILTVKEWLEKNSLDKKYVVYRNGEQPRKIIVGHKHVSK